MNDKETQDLWWNNPTEENQWAISYPLMFWDTDKGFDDQDPSNATVYVREGPPPAIVKIWENGERSENAEAFENKNVGEPFKNDILRQPFLFSILERRQTRERLGKLDDESKAMLKDKHNVDVGG